MNGEDWYYGDSEALGPVSKSSLLGIIQRGDLGADAEVLVLQEDSDKWLPVKEEPGLLFSPIESGAKFSIMEALEFWFRTFLNIVTSLRLLGRCILLYLTSVIAFSIVAWPVQEAGLHFMSVDNWFYTLFCLVVLVFLNNLLELAYINVLLRICEPGTPRFSDLYTRGHLVLDLLGLEFLIGSALPAGLLLLLPQFYYIPVVLFFVALGGFVFLLLVSMMSFFSMVDFETGPITSFQTSFALTN